MLTHLQPISAQPTRVVLLGARGFVARALAQSLAAQAIEIRAISSEEIDLTAEGAAGRLAAQLLPSDSVVMTSGLTPDKGRDAATLMRNLRMAEQVGEALKSRPCGHFIYVSSDAVYDWRHPLVSEALAPSPIDSYSLMHVAREQMLAQAAAAAKIPFCILRPCAIYGAGDTHNAYGPNRFVRAALAGEKIPLFGRGEEMRDHVFIGDVVALFELSLRHRSVGVLNAVSGSSTSFGDVAALVARLSRRPVQIEFKERSGPITHRHFDPTALHYSFPQHRPTSFESGLRAAWPALASSPVVSPPA